MFPVIFDNSVETATEPKSFRRGSDLGDFAGLEPPISLPIFPEFTALGSFRQSTTRKRRASTAQNSV